MHHDALTRRLIHPGDVIDWEFLASQCLDQAFFESINNDPFSGLQWMNLFRINEHVYRELVREFFASFELDDSPCRAEMVKASHLLREFWPSIRDGRFNVGNTKLTSIRDLGVKLAHRCIPTTISGRQESTNRVTEIDLYYLYCIYTQGVEEDDEAEKAAEGEASNEGAGGSADMYRNMSQAIGWHLEEIHVTLAHLEKKQTRLRLYTKSSEEIVHIERGDGVRTKALLEQQVLVAALEELPAATIMAYDKVIQKKAYNTLILCLGDRVLREITKDTTASEHIDEFHKLVSDLEAIDTVILDEDHALLLLTSLPSSYNNFMETLLYGRDILKLEDFEEYLKRDFPRYNHKKSQGFLRNEDQVFYFRVDKYNIVDVMMAMNVEELLDWIMDSGGSYHMTHKRAYLFDFEEYDSGNVLLGDGWNVMYGDKEDSNKAAFVVAGVDNIYAHESLTFNDTFACEVISKWKARLKEYMDARSDVYVLSNGCRKNSDDSDGYYWEYTPANGNVLGLEIVSDQSGNTLRVSQSKFTTRSWIRRRRYNLIPAESKFKTSCSIIKDKYMMKAQVHVSKSSAISDEQALPQRKHHC
nr:zinc finger, CCHC-type [Tanacetum cinerariifolium]